MELQDRRLRRLWLPSAGLALIGLLLALIVLPGSAAIAATQGARDQVIYYDTPRQAGGGPSDYVIGARWDKTDLTYSFSNCPRSLACDAAQEAVRAAIQAWDSVCGLTFTQVQANGDIRFGWYTGDHGDGNPFDGPGEVLAHAFFPLPYLGDLAGDVHFDDAETWVVGYPTARYQVHLQTTAMHELGHALGLDHSTDPNALMWDEYTGVRTLGADDIAGIQALYGPPGPNEGGSVPSAPGAVTATATTTVRLRSGPGTENPQIGTITANATVPVLGRNASSDWLYVESGGVRGWAAAFLFSISGDLNTVPVVDQNGAGASPPPANPPQPSPQPPAPPGNPGSGVTGVAINTVRVRSGPGTSYPPVGAVDAGVTVSIVGRNVAGSWFLIKTSNLQGWAASWLFQVTGDINTVPVIRAQFDTQPGASPLSISVVGWLIFRF